MCHIVESARQSHPSIERSRVLCGRADELGHHRLTQSTAGTRDYNPHAVAPFVSERQLRRGDLRFLRTVRSFSLIRTCLARCPDGPSCRGPARNSNAIRRPASAASLHVHSGTYGSSTQRSAGTSVCRCGLARTGTRLGTLARLSRILLRARSVQPWILLGGARGVGRVVAARRSRRVGGRFPKGADQTGGGAREGICGAIGGRGSPRAAQANSWNRSGRAWLQRRGRRMSRGSASTNSFNYPNGLSNTRHHCRTSRPPPGVNRISSTCMPRGLRLLLIPRCGRRFISPAAGEGGLSAVRVAVGYGFDLGRTLVYDRGPRGVFRHGT